MHSSTTLRPGSRSSRTGAPSSPLLRFKTSQIVSAYCSGVGDVVSAGMSWECRVLAEGKPPPMSRYSRLTPRVSRIFTASERRFSIRRR